MAGSERRRLRNDEARLRAIAAAHASQAASLDKLRHDLTTVNGRMDNADQRVLADEKQLSLTQQQLPPDVTVLAKQVGPSVVVLHCGGTLIGSGFSIALPVAQGFGSVIATAAHVVDACVQQGGPLTLNSSGTEEPVVLRGEGDSTAALASLTDVALLDVTPTIPPLQAATATTEGQFVMVMGSPLFEAFAGNVTTGIVSKVADNYFLHTASEAGGNSGGPVLDREGHVLGLVQGHYPTAENLNVAMRISTICRANLVRGACPF